MINAKRVFDFSLSLIFLALLSLPMMLIAILIKISSRGPAFHVSKRIGKNNEIFYMLKFRTMHTGTPQVATHLLNNSDGHLTKMGKFLRKTSLDEIPQLWNILRNDMSLVGPRPALFNQHDLISLRTEKNIHRLRPGLTGWAQINGRDEISIPLKVSLDHEYLLKRSFFFDLKILLLTLFKVVRRENISH